MQKQRQRQKQIPCGDDNKKATATATATTKGETERYEDFSAGVCAAWGFGVGGTDVAQWSG
jgi:hypothetical protein